MLDKPDEVNNQILSNKVLKFKKLFSISLLPSRKWIRYCLSMLWHCTQEKRGTL